MPINNINAFDNINLKTNQNPNIVRGSLITFNYLLHKPGHDPSPLVLVTDIWDNYIRGVNLHYLTFPTIRKLMFPSIGKNICDNQQMTYQYIKGNGYIVSAFRQYKKAGIQSLKKLNCDFIMKAMTVSKSFNPNEIEAIRNNIREQINRLVNPSASNI